MRGAGTGSVPNQALGPKIHCKFRAKPDELVDDWEKILKNAVSLGV